jgi:hypothetical protein
MKIKRLPTIWQSSGKLAECIPCMLCLTVSFGFFNSRQVEFTPTVQKSEGFRVKASEGEVVVLYFEPSATQNLKSSGFPRCFKGKQHGKIDPILRIHQWRYPRICHFAMILAIIADHYLIFAMLFMQLRAHSKITSHFIRRSIPTGGVAKARNIQIFLRFRALPVERLND